MRNIILATSIFFLTGCYTVTKVEPEFYTTQGIKVTSKNGVVRVYAKLSTQDNPVCTCYKEHRSYDLHELVCVCQDK